MNKKLVAVILMLTMLLGALAGCGDKGDGKPSASGDGAAEETIALCVTGTLGDKALAIPPGRACSGSRRSMTT